MAPTHLPIGRDDAASSRETSDLGEATSRSHSFAEEVEGVCAQL
jgi:hypothetical protein